MNIMTGHSISYLSSPVPPKGSGDKMMLLLAVCIVVGGLGMGLVGMSIQEEGMGYVENETTIIAPLGINVMLGNSTYWMIGVTSNSAPGAEVACQLQQGGVVVSGLYCDEQGCGRFSCGEHKLV